eukprot:SAG22_NODE_229_length_14598_cov_13.257052_10_plen_129_part_00
MMLKLAATIGVFVSPKHARHTLCTVAAKTVLAFRNASMSQPLASNTLSSAPVANSPKILNGPFSERYPAAWSGVLRCEINRGLDFNQDNAERRKLNVSSPTSQGPPSNRSASTAERRTSGLPTPLWLP